MIDGGDEQYGSVVEALYPGRCALCGERFDAGDDICRDHDGECWIHAECRDE